MLTPDQLPRSDHAPLDEECQLCGARAVVDAPTDRGPWAYLCGPCYADHGDQLRPFGTRIWP